jgi:hypothetical protein
MGKKSSIVDGTHASGVKASPQLELSFARKSAAVVHFPKARVSTPAKSSDSALKRLLDYAATLPGK